MPALGADAPGVHYEQSLQNRSEALLGFGHPVGYFPVDERSPWTVILYNSDVVDPR